MARKRKFHSVKRELLEKSREAALSAVQIYNNPNMQFKTESFIVLIVIAWTYLLHAYYRSKGIEYRYHKKGDKRRTFETTPRGSHKYWELEKCLNDQHCPLSNEVITNLKFLIELRHEIEHQMTDRIDEHVSAKIQACCLNYNAALKSLFNYDIAHHQPISIQFFSFGEEQITSLKDKKDIPKNLIDFISSYEDNLSEEEKNSPQYSYRIIYTRDNVNRINQADRAIRFITEGSEEARGIQEVLIKNKQYNKLTQNQVISIIKGQGYESFSKQDHLLFWQSRWPSAKERNEQASEYGETVAKSLWVWFEETWLPEVIQHCEKNFKKT